MLEPENHVRLLDGHSSEVFVCVWNPVYPSILATGGKDSDVILWDLSATASPSSSSDFGAGWRILASMGRLSPPGVQGDITCLHWSSDGKLLAIGSNDGVMRVATRDGLIWMASPLHEGPIFATRFSRKGRLLLTASLDGTVCLWDAHYKRLLRQYRTHNDSCLDVDWVNDTIFASAGADQRVLLMHIDWDEPIKILEGHTEEINQLHANPAGTRIASCSDDGTARIWRTDDIAIYDGEGVPDPGLPTSASVDDKSTSLLLTLEGHSEPISVVGWCPTVASRDGHEILATAAFDKAAKLWDSVTGECLAWFTNHSRPVYNMAFRPDGQFFATIGGDGWLYVYNITTFELVCSWFAGAEKPGVFEVDWQLKDGYNRIALALEKGQVMVFDCMKVPALQ